jgi:hypothetical protein
MSCLRCCAACSGSGRDCACQRGGNVARWALGSAAAAGGLARARTVAAQLRRADHCRSDASRARRLQRSCLVTRAALLHCCAHHAAWHRLPARPRLSGGGDLRSERRRNVRAASESPAACRSRSHAARSAARPRNARTLEVPQAAVYRRGRRATCRVSARARAVSGCVTECPARRARVRTHICRRPGTARRCR